jgi:AcrR family transcriptional regulator
VSPSGIARDLLDLRPVRSRRRRRRCHPHDQAPAPSGCSRTTAAIEHAFVQLVLEQGYERVAVDGICDRADLARATFYARYPNKEAVLFSVYSRLTEDLMQRIAYQDGPWNVVRSFARPPPAPTTLCYLRLSATTAIGLLFSVAPRWLGDQGRKGPPSTSYRHLYSRSTMYLIAA